MGTVPMQGGIMTTQVPGGPGDSYEEHWYRVMKEQALETDAAEEADAARELKATETTGSLRVDDVDVEIQADAVVDHENAGLAG